MIDLSEDERLILVISEIKYGLDYCPKNNNKQNIITRTVTCVPRDSRVDDSMSTFPVDVGHKSAHSNESFMRHIKDLN